MPEPTDQDRIDDVSAGDVITLTDGGPYRVVHVDPTETGFLVTVEPDSGGETMDIELVSGTTVTRTLESKWESPQSPTPNSGV